MSEGNGAAAHPPAEEAEKLQAAAAAGKGKEPAKPDSDDDDSDAEAELSDFGSDGSSSSDDSDDDGSDGSGSEEEEEEAADEGGGGGAAAGGAGPSNPAAKRKRAPGGDGEGGPKIEEGLSGDEVDPALIVAGGRRARRGGSAAAGGAGGSRPKYTAQAELGSDEDDWMDNSYEVDFGGKRRNPLVLVGALATAGVLAGGLVAFKAGNRAVSQQMMRARVLFQGATVALMLGTSGYYTMAAKQ